MQHFMGILLWQLLLPHSGHPHVPFTFHAEDFGFAVNSADAAKSITWQ